MERHSEEHETYVGRFVKLADAIDGGLLRVALVLAALLLAVQAALLWPAARERLSEVDRLEGRSYSFAHPINL